MLAGHRNISTILCCNQAP